MNHPISETLYQFAVTRQGNVISKQVVTNMARRNPVLVPGKVATTCTEDGHKQNTKTSVTI
jgi:hypothetical protein